MNSEFRRDRLVAVVPARAGSRGLPHKNIRELDGVPLYLHAIRQGLRTVGQVLLSSDIESISKEDLPKNCRLCRRPASLAADDTPMAPVLAQLIEAEQLHDRTLVLLQPTSPMRLDEDIEKAIDLYATGQFNMVMSVVERDRGVLKYGSLHHDEFVAMRDPAYCFTNRQNLPSVHGPNGAVYVFSAAQFAQLGDFPSNRIGAVVMPPDRSLDIDTIEDFRRVEQGMIELRAGNQDRKRESK